MIQIRRWRRLAPLGALLLAAACAAPGPRPPAVAPGAPAEAPGDAIRQGVDDPELLALWREAEALRTTGNLAQASARLEQALRRAPGEAVLWSRLAELRLLSGESAQAENLAAKSNVLAAQRPALQYRNWLIIRYARDARGDSDGVDEAQAELERLRPVPAQ